MKTDESIEKSRIGRCAAAALFFLLLTLLACFPAFALDVPTKAAGYVNDYAGILTSNEKTTLQGTLSDFDSQTSNQVIVAIFNSLEGDSLEDFSIRLAQRWKPGQKGKDNGVILLVFVKDRKMRIEVGYGLEHVLTDALSASIIQHEIVPLFKKGQYGQGIRSGVDAIIKTTKGEYTAKPQPTSSRGAASLFKLVFFLFLIIFVNVMRFSRRRPYGIAAHGLYHGLGGSSRGWGGFSSGGFSGGGGSFGGGGSSGSW